MGGIYAQPNLRGGGEYGETGIWRARRQETECVRRFHRGGGVADREPIYFDAEAGDSRREQRRVAGGSLPDAASGLFGATLPLVGVMDMLRFQKFTIGWAWTSDYGSSDDARGFQGAVCVFAAA